jgi:2-amino-4-hydroxy-6-hydroxymethyldihydropteridine diphosphokinase
MQGDLENSPADNATDSCVDAISEEPRIYLGLGSNLGDRAGNLNDAIGRLGGIGLEVLHCSGIYETEPVGLRNQPWFLNQVVECRARGELRNPQGLLSEILAIELALGRRREAKGAVKDGPRVIDIDLLLIGKSILYLPAGETGDAAESQPELIVPHPRMHLRRFVLEPLCEIAPEVIHPVLKISIRELLTGLPDLPLVKKVRAW